MPTQDSMQPQPDTGTPTNLSPEARLTAFLESTLAPMGYELVAIELLNHREKKLCIYIDLLGAPEGGIGIEDCVRVTHALDAPLETQPDLQAIFQGAYELEVSSPGIDRPLRKPSDFERFRGEIARIHTFRALTPGETGNAEYSGKNPKQRNFYGILRGFDPESGSVILGIIADDGTRGKPGKKNQPKPETPIRIPRELVGKANLEREPQGAKSFVKENEHEPE